MSKLKDGFWEGDSVFPHVPSFLVAGSANHGGDTLHHVSSLVNPIVWFFNAGLISSRIIESAIEPDFIFDEGSKKTFKSLKEAH